MKIYNARWSQFFAHSDLIAGWEYACRGKIIDIKQSSKSIKATVKGSKSYKQSFDVVAVFCAMADLLKEQKKITPKQIKRAQEFTDKYSSSLSSELVSEIMNSLHSNQH